MVETKNLKMKQRFHLRLWRNILHRKPSPTVYEIFRDHVGTAPPLGRNLPILRGTYYIHMERLITHSAPLLFPRIVYNTIHTDIYTFFCFGKDIRIE